MPIAGLQSKSLTLKPQAPAVGGFDVPPIVTVDRQCRACWCWVAVTLSIARVRTPKFNTQQDLAWAVLQGQPGVTEAECKNPACDPGIQGGASNQASDRLPLGTAGAGPAQVLQGGEVTSAILCSEVAAGRPVGMILTWQDGSSHAVAVVGGAADANGDIQFFVGDPMVPTVPPHTFDDLMNRYQNAIGGPKASVLKAYKLL